MFYNFKNQILKSTEYRYCRYFFQKVPNTVPSIPLALPGYLIRGGGPKPQIKCNDVIRIFWKETFCGAKILQMRRSEAVACVLAYNQDFAIGKGLEPPEKV